MANIFVLLWLMSKSNDSSSEYEDNNENEQNEDESSVKSSNHLNEQNKDRNFDDDNIVNNFYTSEGYEEEKRRERIALLVG